jgi:hypothetical protein
MDIESQDGILAASTFKRSDLSLELELRLRPSPSLLVAASGFHSAGAFALGLRFRRRWQALVTTRRPLAPQGLLRRDRLL